MHTKWLGSWLVGVLIAAASLNAAPPIELVRNFVNPPTAARPWVYWFWLNGNMTREGITADLEAMKRVGIGGVLIMEVDQGAPLGPAAFMSDSWRALFRHAVSEAQRLGLEINMNDDAGCNGSGGPWIKPEESMQKVVGSETNLTGPLSFTGSLAPPPTLAGYYRDIAVLGFPTPGSYRIENIAGKAAYERQGNPPASETKLPPEMVIDPATLTNLTARMDANGRLTWDIPAGAWTVMRLGHTSTGVENAPAPASGRGLECDKLSAAGIEAQFAGMMARLIADVGNAAGRTLVATHIDSWENGAQNWTARMREEFQQRRGYDLIPFLPAMSGRVIGSLELSERFLWDLRQTVNDLLLENYAGRMEQLAQQHGLRLSIEAYGGPCDDIAYGGRADEPMCEFWIGGGAFETCKEMASAAHTYGHPILGAESFTADDHEKWLQHPATIKALGDRAFCEGVNRFVFHRYAMQPWLNYQPGMTMGPWGLHYERTSTWWETSRPWHEYLARCQFMLRQGQFVADICYVQPEESPQGFVGHSRHGYDFDNCPAEVVLKRVTVKDGRIVLPDGMNYRLLVLPDTKAMTPALLRKVKELVAAGATVVGPTRPVRSPGLAGYPACDAEVQQLAQELWGGGKIIADKTPEQVLARLSVPRDFAGGNLRWIHRQTADMDIYFVASSRPQPTDVLAEFRVADRAPQLWSPETGRIELPVSLTQAGGVTRIPLHLEPSGSVFVVFQSGGPAFRPVDSATHDGQPFFPAPEIKGPVVITKAQYGVLGDPKRTRDVRAKLQAVVDAGELNFQVARMAAGDDPAFGVVKTLEVEYTAGGQPLKASGQDPEDLSLQTTGGAEPVATLNRLADGRLQVEAREPGRYMLTSATGKIRQWEVTDLPAPVEISGPWELRFPPNWGAPAQLTLPKLISWSEHSDSGVKYFSGTATYRKTIQVPRAMLGGDRRLWLDLGNVQVMATVSLNGQDLGLLWKPPYRVDITRVAKAGDNALEARVVNLWPNRLIGDQQLPADSARNPEGTLKEWPQWVREGKPSPTGRFTFTTWELWKKDASPIPSGLLGPVRLVPVDVRRFRN